MADIIITPGSSLMAFTSSGNFKETLTQDASGSLVLYGSGSTGRTEIFSVAGNNGTLFSVSDDLSNSLFSVNTIAGLPVIEAFADNAVNIGKYGAEAIVVSGSGGDLQLSGSVKLVSLGTAADTNVVVFNSTTKKLAYNTALSLQGATGAQGGTGIQGTTGGTGTQGATGTQGETGIQGIQGIYGTQGTYGTQGIQGIYGTQGTYGTQGIQGIYGTQGTYGTQGIQGIYGTQGIQGIYGTQGTYGTQGIQGISGGGGITINPTDYYIPYRSNATTFSDSFWRIDPFNSDVMETTYGVGGSQQGIQLNFDAPQFLLTDEFGYSALRWDSFRRLYSNNSSQVALDWQEASFPKTAKTTSEIYQNDFYVSVVTQSAVIDSSIAAESLWWSGHVIEGTEGDITSVGDVCYLRASAGTWSTVDFNTSNATLLLGIYLGNSKFLLDGHVIGYNAKNAEPYVGLQDVTTSNYSSPLYGNVNIPGFMQNPAPSGTGDYARILGHAYKCSSDGHYYLILFRPSNDWVLI